MVTVKTLTLEILSQMKWNSANMTPDHTCYLENDDDAENLKNDRGPLSM